MKAFRDLLFDLKNRMKTGKSLDLNSWNSQQFRISDLVQTMFHESGAEYSRQDDIFITDTECKFTSFRTVISCDNGNSMLVYTSFPIPVPSHIAVPVSYEINRINRVPQKARVVMQDGKGEYSIVSVTHCTFDRKPVISEIKALLDENIAMLDDGNYKSIMSAIMGVARFEDFLKHLFVNAMAKKKGEEIISDDPYMKLRKDAEGVSPARFSGRLLVLAASIIDRHHTEGTAASLLDGEIPFNELVQKAYDAADETERDVLRKLLFLSTPDSPMPHSDDESILGRIEAIPMIAGDIYSLLEGEDSGDSFNIGMNRMS